MIELNAMKPPPPPAPVIEFARLPSALGGPSWRVYVVQGAVAILLAVLALLPSAIRDAIVGASIGRSVLTLAVIFPLAIVATFLGRALWRRSRSMPVVPWDASAIETAVGERFSNLPYDGPTPARRWDWRELEPRLRELEASVPRTVAEVRLRPCLDTIERPVHLLEPEAILPSAHGNRTGMVMAGLFLAMALLQLSIGSVGGVALFIGLLVPTVLLTPAVRDRLRIALPWDGNLIAGQGWVRDVRGRTWRAGEALMILGVGPWGSLWIVLTGPHGVRTLGFVNETDPDFIRLWQAWNHPDPRPELAGRGDRPA